MQSNGQCESVESTALAKEDRAENSEVPKFQRDSIRASKESIPTATNWTLIGPATSAHYSTFRNQSGDDLNAGPPEIPSIFWIPDLDPTGTVCESIEPPLSVKPPQVFSVLDA